MALTQKEIDEMAYATIRGDYGNGEARKQALGSNYNEVQKRVNELSKQSGGASNVKAPSSSSTAPKQTTQKTTVSAAKANSAPTQKATVQTVTKKETAPKEQIVSKERQNNINKTNIKEKEKAKTENKTANKPVQTISKADTKLTMSDLKNSVKADVDKSKKIEKKATDSIVKTPIIAKKTGVKVDTERARKNYEQKIGHVGSTNVLSAEDSNAIKKIIDFAGTGKTAEKNISKFAKQNLESKYGKTAKELLEMYEQERLAKDKKFSDEHPVLGTAKAMAGNTFVKPALGLESTLTNLVSPKTAEKIESDYGNALKRTAETTANLKEGASKDLGNVGKTVYNMGTGMAENVLPKMLGLGTPLWVINSAGNTAGDTLLSAQGRGVGRRASAGEALGNSAIDALLNVKGLETIKGLQSTGNLGKDLLKQMAVGGGEQAITNFGQDMLDSALSGDNSVFSTTFDNYIAQGYDGNQALWNTLKDMGGNFVTNVGTGVLVGGALGSGRKLLSDVVNPRIPSIFTPENRADANVIIPENTNYRWGRTADRLIPQDSYARTQEYMDLDNQYKTNFEQIEQLKQRRTELNNALATESTPKPREEWNTQDEIQALLGETPMNYTENGNRMLAELDGIKQSIGDLESKNSLINEDRDLIKGNTRVNRLENYTPKEFVPATRENYQGFSTSKGVHNDLVQSGKAQLVEMSPEEYIRRCADEIFKDNVATLESVISSRDQKNIDKYAQMMKEGTEFDTPYLDYDTNNQEGLHRALAAYEAGLDVMPVVVKGTPSTGDLDYSARNRISEINSARFERENPIGDLDIDDEILFDDIPNPYGLPKIDDVISDVKAKKQSGVKITDTVEKAFLKDDVLDTHSPQKIQEMNDYIDSVDNNIVDFMKRRRNNPNAYLEPITIGKVNDAAGRKIRELTGLETTNNDIIFNQSSAAHIDKKHGVNGKSDHSMADDNSTARINYVLENFDDAFLGDNTTNALRTADGKPAPKVVFYKKVDGTYYAVETISDGKSGNNLIISAYTSDTIDGIKKEANSMPNTDTALGFTSDNEVNTMLPFEENLSQNVGTVNNVVNPSVLPRQEAEPIRNIPSPQSDFIVPDMDADLAQSSERGISRTYDNYLERNGLTSSVTELRNAERQYDVRHNSTVVDDATNTLQTQEDVDYWKKGYITGRNKINSDTDVVRATMLLQDVVNKSKETRNIGERTQLEAEATMLRRKIRKAGTDISHGLHAFDILNGTSEGAIINTQRIFDKNVEDWSKKNTNSNKAIDNVAKQLTSSKVDKALSDMGNDSLKAKNMTPKKPMSHEELLERVKGSFSNELSSVENQFRDSDYEFVASMVEANVPTNVITDEIQHRLDHGEWYTIDESIPVKAQESSKLNSILKNMGDDRRKAKNQKEPTPKSHATLVEEVRNSIQNEMASSDINKASDYDFIATMLEENVPNSVIEDEIQHRLLHGEWYTLDESIEPKMAENSVLKRAVDMLVEPDEVEVEKPAPTFDEIRQQVQTTLNNNSQIFYNNKRQFNESDVDYLSNLIANGASSNDISESIKNRLVNGVWDVPEKTINKVNELWDEARHLPMNSKARVDLETQAYWELANCNGENSSLADKFESWRFLAMLGNPKTHVRNIIGNALFGGVNKISDAVASGIEYGVDSLTKNGIERTKSILTPKDNDLLRASAKDATENAYRQLSGNKYLDNAKASIKMQKEVFNSPFMRKLNEINSKALDKEDTLAMQNTYKRVLASFLKANGADASIFDAEPRLKNLEAESRVRLLSDADMAEMNNLKSQIDLLEKGREYAVGKAEYAAFHEDNAFANWLKNASNSTKTKGGRILIEGLVPFKTTPANILRSGLEYSPLNIVNDAYKAVQLKKGNVNASDLIDSMSKTLTGSGLMMLGIALQRKGVLNSSDEETKWQDELEGIQNYSLTVGGKTFTIDFAVPSAMPLLLGAEIAKAIDRSGNTSLDEDENAYAKIESVIQAVSRIASPIMETSMLSGVNDTLESLAYNGIGEAIPSLLGSLTTGYVSQGIPTLLGQLSRTIDNTRRSTYSDKSGLGKTIDKAITKTTNKLPISRFNEPYVDAYGRVQQNAPSNNILSRAFYQFLSPSYIQDINTTDVDSERRRLYNAKDELGNPITNEKVFSDLDTKGEVAKRKLSKEEYTDYTKKKGEIDYGLSLELLKNDRYKSLDDTEKADLMKKSEDIAKKLSASDFGGALTKTEQKYLDIYNESGTKGLADALLPSEYDTFIEENNLGDEEPLKQVGAYINSLNVSPEEKAKAFIDIYKNGDVSKLKKEAKEFYDNGEYIQFLNSYLAPKESSKTSNSKASAKPTQSSATKSVTETQDFSPQDYVSTTQYGTKSFNRTKGLPMLDEIYKDDNVAKSQAIIESGANTKGIKATRNIMGDDYVYDYYAIENYGGDYTSKAELLEWLQSQGRENEFDLWWQVFKSK